MLERPRTGTVCLVLAAAAAIGAASLEIGPSTLLSSGEGAGGTSMRSEAPRALGSRPPPELSFSGALLEGRVLEPGGEPIAGALIEASGFAVCSGSDGTFAIPRGRAALRVSHRGYFPREIEAPGPDGAPRAGGAGAASPAGTPGDGDLVVVLFPGARLRGRVTDSAGSPVAGARLRIGSDLGAPVAEPRTDAGGRWETDLLPPGQLHVLCVHPDFQSATEDLTLAPGDHTLAPMALERGRPLAVTARDIDGQPLPDARITTWTELHSGAGSQGVLSRIAGYTGERGELFFHAPPGDGLRVRALLAGYREALQRVPPPGPRPGIDGAPESVELVLEPAPAVHAQAVDGTSGLPVEPIGAVLEMRSDGAFQSVPHRGVLFHPLAQGKVRIGLPPQKGTYRAVVRARGGLQGASEPIAFDGRTPPPPVLVRVAPRRHIRGFVLAGGVPLAGARVELLERAGGAREPTARGGVPVPPAPGVFASTTSDAGGRFAFEDAPDRPFRLAVEHPGFAAYLSAPLALPFPGAEDSVSVVLAKGRAIRGRVLAADGEPAADTAVLLESDRVRARLAWTGAAGRYEFRGLPPGRFRLAVSPHAQEAGPGGGAGSRVVELEGGHDVVCDLRTTDAPAGSLAGRVFLDGEPLETVLELVPVGEPSGRLELRTDAGGRFLARPLAPGAYRLRAPSRRAERAVAVAAGRRTEVEVRLESLEYAAECVSARTPEPLGTGCRAVLSREDAGGRHPVRSLDGSPRLEFTGLLPGWYHLRVEAEGHVPLERRFELTASRRERLELEPGSSIDVQLLRAGGTPFRGGIEYIVCEGAREVCRGRAHVIEHLRLPVLARGEYVLTVRADGRELRYAITVGP